MLEKKIGQGGYSSVWKVVRKSDGQPYALKVTSLRSLSRLDCEAVVEEVRLLASMHHPNILVGAPPHPSPSCLPALQYHRGRSWNVECGVWAARVFGA